MIEKINNNQIQNIADEAGNKKAKSDKVSRPNDNGSVSLHINNTLLLEKAAQITIEDTDSLERARKLLLQDRLESTENILAAAQNIVMFGI